MFVYIIMTAACMSSKARRSRALALYRGHRSYEWRGNASRASERTPFGARHREWQVGLAANAGKKRVKVLGKLYRRWIPGRQENKV